MTTSGKTKTLEFEIPASMFGQRVDKALGTLCDELSRSAIQALLKQGLVLVDDETPRQKDKVFGGEHVEISVPSVEQGGWVPQELPLDIVFEDDHLLVVNKQAGLVVHPGAGNLDGTLLNAILFFYPESRQIARAGIVHRLDKDTSGLMVIAKTESARLNLVDQLVDHSVEREYLALCYGRIISGGTVEEPLARDPHDRRKMSVNAMGKEAVTHYRVEERYRHHTLVQVNLETGRTHQIRVHMNHLGFGLVGDPVYGRRLAIPADCDKELEFQLRGFKRQALHARKLSFIHPETGEEVSFASEIPQDFSELIAACRNDINE